MAGAHGEADDLFNEALAQERALRSLPLEARTLHWWGRALVRRGETARGYELMREARALTERLGMPAVTRQIDELSVQIARH